MSVDLSTTYLGMRLNGPLVVSACPLTQQLDVLRRLVDSGASAAVLPSLFEEQIEHDELELSRMQDFGTESFAESLTYFPEQPVSHTGTESYLNYLTEAKRAVDIPIIGSLNGTSTGEWIHDAKRMEDAGADALELNIYTMSTNCETSSISVENQCLGLVAAVNETVSIPLAVKISPFYTALGNMAKQLVSAGADGLVLFNRGSQADIDLDELEVVSRFTLSHRSELMAPLRWVAILHGHVDASLAATGGIHTADGLAKVLLAGADVGMVASIIYREGPEVLTTMLADLSRWMQEHEYDSIEQLKGSMSHDKCPDPTAFARASYMKSLKRLTGPAI